MRTDEQGVARFDSVPPGRASARVVEPGFLGGRAVEVRIDAVEPAVARLTEDLGHPVSLRVRTENGTPLPGCRIELPADYAAIDADGEQDLRPATGPGGVVLLPRVPATVPVVTLMRGARTMKVALGSEPFVEVTFPE